MLLGVAVLVGFGLWARWFHLAEGGRVLAWIVVGVMGAIGAVYQMMEIDGERREVKWKWLLFGCLVLWTKKLGFEEFDGVKLIKDTRGQGADVTEVWAVAVMMKARYVEVARFEESSGLAWDKVREEASALARRLSDMMRVPMTYRLGDAARESRKNGEDWDDDEGAWL